MIPRPFRYQSVLSTALALGAATLPASGLYGAVGEIAVNEVQIAGGGGSTSVGWFEYSMVLLLILLNVLIVYRVFVRFDQAMLRAKRSLVTVIASMLILCIWAGIRLSRQLTDGWSFFENVSRSYNWVFLVALFAASMGIFVASCYHLRKKSLIRMSPSTKMVFYKDEWVSIEEFLAREMGIEVSHGMTCDEAAEAMREYQSEVTRNGGIPKPQESPGEKKTD
jgi:hypothetical protein